jgi:cob(I)alamin adenosyltransferase
MYINKISNIATKQGDNGTSKNYNNQIYRKSDIIFETLGTIDELSSFLGLTYHFSNLNQIIIIQNDLQKLSSIIATSPKTELYSKIKKITTDDVELLEKKMQSALDKKPIQPKLFLPGSEKSKIGAYFDVCRTLARRVERRIDEFIMKHNRDDLETVRSYINRLSDYLFILSCNL